MIPGNPKPKNETGADALVSRDMADALAPGVAVEMEPEVAEEAGAFEETAIDAQAAWDANPDLQGE